MIKDKSYKKADYSNAIPKYLKHFRLNKHDSKVKYLIAHGYILCEFYRLNEINLTEAFKRYNQLKENKNYKWDYSINKMSGYFDIFRANIKTKEKKGCCL